MSIVKVGRNDPCPCGSGKKYKQCCQQKIETTALLEASASSTSNASIAQLIKEALSQHKAGQIQMADSLYQQVLQIAPNHPDALHLSGVIATAAGQLDRAVELISKAIQIHPTSHMHFNLGNAYKAKDNLDAAIQSYRAALALESDYVDAHRNLGIALRAKGELTEALASFKRAIALQPNYAEVHSNLGLVLKELGRLEESIISYQKAIALKPTYAEAYCNLGVALKEQGKLNEALEHYFKAISLKPDYAQAHNNMGNVLVDMGEFDIAIHHFTLAIQYETDFAEGYNNLGNVFNAQGKVDAAMEAYQRAMTLKPDFAMPYNNLANILLQKRAFDSAIDFFNQALKIDPQFVEAHYNLGNALQAREMYDAAIACYQRAIALKPDFALVYNNMGNAFKAQSQLAQAMTSYRTALQYQANLAVAHNNIGAILLEQGDPTAAIKSYRQALALDPLYLEAHSNILFAMCSDPDMQMDSYYQEAIRYGDAVKASATPFSTWHSTSVDKQNQPLRVGMVSGDFRSHPVGFFLENILAHINPARISLVAYATQAQEDALTIRIKPHFAQWHCIADLSDAQAAQKIHDDGIDILIDLAGHTAHNRLPVFAWKPAPVQLSWLGYFATTGVQGMDYLLTDQVAVPKNHAEAFSESIFYLADTRLCFTPPAPEDALPLTVLPALHNGYITFGCFQNLTKLNDYVLAAWGQILQALPQAKLHLQNRQMACPHARQALIQRLIKIGISEERVSINAYVPRNAYLAAHNAVDIMLDTFPYPGGTTTCEALWMGVPTITLAGNTMLSRQGASLLTCANLSDWIANSEQEYIAKAIEAAQNLAQLSQLRSRLRQQVLVSPMFDAKTFALHLEGALRTMFYDIGSTQPHA